MWETKRLYFEDSHQREFTARVLFCRETSRGFEAFFSETAFFPEGGGQAHDTGVVETGTKEVIRVLEVRDTKEGICHLLDKPVEEGADIVGKIDWQQRFLRMQNHSGEHIVSGLVHRAYGLDNVGFHMGKEEITIDFNGPLTWEQLLGVEREANQAVTANLPVQTLFPGKEEEEEIEYRSKKEIAGQVRVVVIPGVDACACCAPHVKYTGEIGLIKLLSGEKYKGGTRVRMLAGAWALYDYEKRHSQIAGLSALLSAKPDMVEERVRQLVKEEEELKEAKNYAMQRWFSCAASQIPADADKILMAEEKFSQIEMRLLANEVLKRTGGSVCVCTFDENGCRYCMGSMKEDIRPLGKKLNEALKGRGGGSREMIQGTWQATVGQVREILLKEGYRS